MKCFLILLQAFVINFAKAQFYLAEKEIIPPSIILIDQYQTVPERAFDLWKNNWDANNLYTRIVAIRDQQGKLYHILYQENFSGRLLFFSYSKNLSPVFNRADRPMQQFDKCILDHVGVLKVLHEANAVIDCFMQRLAYCTGEF